jgi:hypothetical protein
MNDLTLLNAQTDDAWRDRETLDRLKAAAVDLEARIQVIEFRQTSTAIDPPHAA